MVINFNFALSCTATILGIGGALLNIYKFKWAFIIWNIGNLILIYKAIDAKDYPNMILFIFYFIINIKGFIKWKNDERKEHK